MKIVMQAIIGSIIIHIAYFVTVFLVGYIKTSLYKPNIQSEWDNLNTLQNEVAFGMTVSPVFIILTLVGVAVICGIIIYFYKKLFFH
ncbi:hypothetical protein [Bacillus xiapuensis]|uniref:Menaquinol-cytochrome c reductase cytochrome b subunit n=1 Tax=Bacillus xiapuensis TaxID=2014075 RepID=A0ABU6N9T7_9BACI|nr:hypothetical protein [Bacillus xiapuensis]